MSKRDEQKTQRVQKKERKLGFHDKSIVRYRVIVRWIGLLIIFVKIIEEIIDFFLDLDRYGVIKGDVMFGLKSGAAHQKREEREKNEFQKRVHISEDKLNFRPHATEY